jgi:homocysteine S-methyltransferase
VDDLITWHRPRFEALIEAGADLLGFETIPAMIEARALIQLLKEYPKMKAWVSFSCQVHIKIVNYYLFVYIKNLPKYDNF